MKSRKAWVYQHPETKSWYVGWYEPNGKRRKKSFGNSKREAKDFAATKQADLVTTIGKGYQARSWDQFADDFRDQVLSLKAPASGVVYNKVIDHVTRICKPQDVHDIDAEAISRYIAQRSKERGKSSLNRVSPVTINKELACIKSMLNRAHEWKVVRELPKIRKLKVREVGPTFISQDDFAKLFAACDVATRPNVQGIIPGDWWRAFLLFSFLTGWRISELVALRRDDVDYEAGYAITRAEDNKGGRESRVALHSVVLEAMEKIRGFAIEAFPWPHEETAIYDQLHLIQDSAGIVKTCRKAHKCSESCRYYGFHDLRRGFATANAANLSASQLQTLMRHKSYQTTQKYIAMAEQAKRDDVVERLTVPVLKVSS